MRMPKSCRVMRLSSRSSESSVPIDTFWVKSLSIDFSIDACLPINFDFDITNGFVNNRIRINQSNGLSRIYFLSRFAKLVIHLRFSPQHEQRIPSWRSFLSTESFSGILTPLSLIDSQSRFRFHFQHLLSRPAVSFRIFEGFVRGRKIVCGTEEGVWMDGVARFRKYDAMIFTALISMESDWLQSMEW